jgi:dephospho-CoA kinase
MLKVALTGGIGTGKTYVLQRLQAAGVPTIDADALVHQALGPGSAVGPQIAARFGAGIVTTEGGIDRPKLAALVFSDRAARCDLESIVHPVVWLAVQAWLDGLSAGDLHAVAVADIPLLYETGHETMFDRVIVVACSPDRQLRRVMERDAIDEADARRRIAAQWPLAEKARRADFVIWSDGTFAETDRQVAAVLQALSDPLGSLDRV